MECKKRIWNLLRWAKKKHCLLNSKFYGNYFLSELALFLLSPCPTWQYSASFYSCLSSSCPPVQTYGGGVVTWHVTWLMIVAQMSSIVLQSNVHYTQRKASSERSKISFIKLTNYAVTYSVLFNNNKPGYNNYHNKPFSYSSRIDMVAYTMLIETIILATVNSFGYTTEQLEAQGLWTRSRGS